MVLFDFLGFHLQVFVFHASAPLWLLDSSSQFFGVPSLAESIAAARAVKSKEEEGGRPNEPASSAQGQVEDLNELLLRSLRLGSHLADRVDGAVAATSLVVIVSDAKLKAKFHSSVQEWLDAKPAYDPNAHKQPEHPFGEKNVLRIPAKGGHGFLNLASARWVRSPFRAACDLMSASCRSDKTRVEPQKWAQTQLQRQVWDDIKKLQGRSQSQWLIGGIRSCAASETQWWHTGILSVDTVMCRRARVASFSYKFSTGTEMRSILSWCLHPFKFYEHNFADFPAECFFLSFAMWDCFSFISMILAAAGQPKLCSHSQLGTGP